MICRYPGKPGADWVERADGSRSWLKSTGRVDVEAGDVFVIETPGGGGYGPPPGEEPAPAAEPGYLEAGKAVW